MNGQMQVKNCLMCTMKAGCGFRTLYQHVSIHAEQSAKLFAPIFSCYKKTWIICVTNLTIFNNCLRSKQRKILDDKLIMQNGQEILVMKHETNGEGQDILGESEESDRIEGSVGGVEAW